jgi:hypothetical protein
VSILTLYPDPRSQPLRSGFTKSSTTVTGWSFTRNGHDWTDRYPLIVEAALRNRANSFVLDGAAALLGVDGVSDFDGLRAFGMVRNVETPLRASNRSPRFPRLLKSGEP